MASTIAIYTGNGSTTDFTVPFDYLSKHFIRVSVDNSLLTGGDYGDTSKDYYFLDKTTVRLKTPPKSGAGVVIRRYTSATNRVVTFKDASILKANDLDVSSIQTIHIAEEGRDVVNDALIKDPDGNWDAKGNRIVNVADPINPQDVVTKAYYDKDSQLVQANKDEVVKLHGEVTQMTEENRTLVQETRTLHKETEKNATEAKASAGTAVSSAKVAQQLRDEVEASRNQVKESEANVIKLEKQVVDNEKIVQENTNKTAQSEAKAKDWAIKMGAPVEGEEYSAKHHATEAKKSEQVATDKANQIENIAGTVVPIAPEIKVVADNITHVVTDSQNIDKINIVGADLTGSLSDSVFEDYGDLGDIGSPLPTIEGGNIKVVADNIDDVKTVAGLASEFETVINSVDTVTKLTQQATEAKEQAERFKDETLTLKETTELLAKGATADSQLATEKATEATTQANKAKDWAIKMDDTVDGQEYSAKYYANKAKTEGGQAVTQAQQTAINAIKSQETASVSSVNTAGTTQVAKVTTEGTKQVQAVSNEGTSQIEMISEAGTTEVGKVTAEGSAKVTAITAEGTKQVKAVTDKGTEQKALLDTQVTKATAQANKATQEATKAEQQATLATTKADEADDSATMATQKATEAQTSATNSANSAKTATEQATIATTQAGLAKTNADNSALSKDEATKQAVEAKKQADLAKGYAEQSASGQVNADWAETVSTSKAFIKNKPVLGKLASKDSVAYTEITGAPPQPDLSSYAKKTDLTPLATKAELTTLATKNELQTGLGSKANTKHTHTIAEVTGLQAHIDDYEQAIVAYDEEILEINTKLTNKLDTNVFNTHVSEFNAYKSEQEGFIDYGDLSDP